MLLCKGCGRPVHRKRQKPGTPDEEVVSVEMGRVDEDETFSGEKQWGYMHRVCFLRAIGADLLEPPVKLAAS